MKDAQKAENGAMMDIDTGSQAESEEERGDGKFKKTQDNMDFTKLGSK